MRIRILGKGSDETKYFYLRATGRISHGFEGWFTTLFKAERMSVTQRTAMWFLLQLPG